MANPIECLTTILLLGVLVCVGVLGVPMSEENTLGQYERRIKLLTGGEPVPTCHQNENDLGDCLKRVFRIMLPHVAKGVPELNIPSGEPLLLNTTSFRFNIGATNGRLQVKNTEIHGFTDHELKDVDFKVENGNTKYKMDVFVPKLNVHGNYKAVVTINNQFNFKPHGTFNLTLYDIAIPFTSEGKLFEKDGHKFLRLHKIDANPKIGNMDIDVTGIFEDPELNKFVVNAAKDYWREVYRIMLPETRQYWAPYVVKMFNEVLALVPYDAYIKDE